MYRLQKENVLMQVDIYYRFNVAVSTAISRNRDYIKKGCVVQYYAAFHNESEYFFTATPHMRDTSFMYNPHSVYAVSSVHHLLPALPSLLR